MNSGSKHILMVDDVATNLKCAEEVLKDNYRITTAKSAKQAVALLTGEIPDLLLLDINMPEMNGYELFEYIQNEMHMIDLPTIFLTADTDREAEIRGLKMGAVDFIRKPFEPEVMISRIEKAMRVVSQKKELETIAKKDSLTNLWNRRYLEEYVALPTDGQDTVGIFMLLDMDNFKEINDTFGHHAGDEVLTRFAKILEEESGLEEGVCRIGGDEFAVYMRGEYTQEVVKNIARQLIAKVEYETNNMLGEDTDIRISVSIGISTSPEDGMDFLTLYNKADKALYFVKQNGKRGYHFYHEKDANGLRTMMEESNAIDLLQLQMLLGEKSDRKGAYKVEYDGFKKIYRFVNRCVERSNQEVQIVLFTIESSSNIAEQDREAVIDLAMEQLDDAVCISLRRGDVATSCNSSQYVVILMDASNENGEMVARRIQKKWMEKVENDDLKLTYQMRSVEREDNHGNEI